MHPLDLPKPLSDMSTFLLLDLAVLHLSLVDHPDPNHELAIRSSHLAFLLSPNFTPLFHLQRVHRLLPVYYFSDMSLAIDSGISTFLCKITEPSPSHTDALSSSLFSSTSSIVGRILCGAELLPRLRAPVDSTCAMTLFGGILPLMASFRRAGTTCPFKSVHPAASPATSSVFSLESVSASRVSSSGSTAHPTSPR